MRYNFRFPLIRGTVMGLEQCEETLRQLFCRDTGLMCVCVLQLRMRNFDVLQCAAVCHSVLQCVAVFVALIECFGAMQCVAVRCGVLQYVLWYRDLCVLHLRMRNPGRPKAMKFLFCERVTLLSLTSSIESLRSAQCVKRDSQKRRVETKSDLQKRPTKETHKRDLPKRHTRGTDKRDLDKSKETHRWDAYKLKETNKRDPQTSPWLCPVQQFFSELGDNSAQTHWTPRIRTDSKGNKMVKRVDLKQQTVQLVLPPANVQRSFCQVLASDTVPNTRHWQCNDQSTDFIDWIDKPHTPSRQSRVVSQNVGRVGIWNSIPTVQRILSSHNPAVVLLQDCRVKNSAREQVHTQLWEEWPQYEIFIRCGTRMRGRSNAKRSKKIKRKHTYHYSVITMVHKSAGSAPDSFQHVKADGFDEGRLLTVKIRPDRRPILFVSNVYNHVAADSGANSSRPSLTSLVHAYYTLNHSVTFIWLVATTTHPSFMKHVRVTATAVRLKRPTCASKNSLSTLSAQSLGGQDTLKEVCSHDVARNLLRPLNWTKS